MAKKPVSDVDRLGRLDRARRAMSDNDLDRHQAALSKRHVSATQGLGNGGLLLHAPQHTNGVHAGKGNGHGNGHMQDPDRTSTLYAPTPVRHLPPHYNRPTNVVQTPPLTSILRPSSSRSATTSRFNTPEQTSDESDTLHRHGGLGGGPGTADAAAGLRDFANTAASDNDGGARPRAGRWSSTTSLSRLTGSATPLSFLPAANVEGALRPSIVPTYEYYGFALYLSSTVLFLVYLVWGVFGADKLESLQHDLRLPSVSQIVQWLMYPLSSTSPAAVSAPGFLHDGAVAQAVAEAAEAASSSRNNDYAISLPSAWWSLAVPSWLVVLLGYTYVALACWNTQRLTPPLHDARTVTDGFANVCDGRRSPARRRRRRRRRRQPRDIEDAVRVDDITRHENGAPGLCGAQAGTEKAPPQHSNGASSGRCKTDKAADGDAPYDRTIDQWTKGTNGVLDLPPGLVSLALYGGAQDGAESTSADDDDDAW